MDQVRVAIIGMGSMGSSHARAFLEGRIPGARLAAVCDADGARLASFAAVPGFSGWMWLAQPPSASAMPVMPRRGFSIDISIPP